MRKKVGGGVGQVVVVLEGVGRPVVTLSVVPAEPPLRVGMSNAEVRQAFGWIESKDDSNLYSDLLISFDENPGRMGDDYCYSIDREQGPDWLRIRQSFSVYFGNKGRDK